MTRTACLFLSPLALLLAGCGGADAAAQPQAAAPAVAARVLTIDPGAALEVLASKANGPAEHIVVHGRIASIVKGYAAFTLMDTKLPYCGEVKPEDNCKTPWDYCCEKPETRTAHALAVEMRDADGQPLATPALPDLRLLDEVKVTGKLSKDEHGNFAIAATGVWKVARPQLPQGLNWPQ